MSRVCHRCGRAVEVAERVGRRDACVGCGSDLHCCLNCSFYDSAYHNQCRELQAERQVDKERGNFCDHFAFADAAARPASTASDARAQLDRLFAGRRPVAAGDADGVPAGGRRAVAAGEAGRGNPREQGARGAMGRGRKPS